MDLSTAQEIAQAVLHMAMRSGDHAEAYVQVGRSLKLQQILGQSPVLTEGTERGVALRVWKGERFGFACSNDLGQGSLKQLPTVALTCARETGVMEPATLPEGPLPDIMPSADALRLLDSDYAALTASDRVPLFNRVLNAGGLGPNRLLLYQDSCISTAVTNSFGRSAGYASTTYTLCLVQNETGSLAEATSSHSFRSLTPEDLIDRGAGNLLTRNGDVSVLGPQVDVLLSPRVAAELVRSIAVLFSAENVLKMLPMMAGKVGRSIASPVLTLVDDPLLPGALNSRPVDDEGSPCERTVLLQDGVLRNFLHRCATATAMQTVANGKALRTSIQRLPRVAQTNLFLQPGPHSHGDLRRQLDQGLEVVGTSRRGSLNPATGEWSMIADGWWVKEGCRRYPVTGVRISCSLFEALRNAVAVGNNLEFMTLAGGAGAPSVLLRGLRIAQ